MVGIDGRSRLWPAQTAAQYLWISLNHSEIGAPGGGFVYGWL